MAVMAHQAGCDGGTWRRGAGVSTWMPCGSHVHERLSRILRRETRRISEKSGKNCRRHGKSMTHSSDVAKAVDPVLIALRTNSTPTRNAHIVIARDTGKESVSLDSPGCLPSNAPSPPPCLLRPPPHLHHRLRLRRTPPSPQHRRHLLAHLMTAPN